MSDTGVEYDPSTNPRALLMDEVEDTGRIIEELEDERAGFHRVTSMFHSKGWQTVAAKLYEQMQVAIQEIANPSMDDRQTQFVRGQLFAYQVLFGMEDDYDKQKQFIDMKLEQLKGQQGK